MTVIRFSLIGIIFLILSGCEKAIETSGQYLTEAESNKIQRGMTQGRVKEILGPPSYISAVDSSFWAYIGTKLQVRLFQNPTPIERRIVAIDFSGDSVGDIIFLSLKDGKQIFPNSDRTPTNGRSISLLEELIGNIGRF